MEIHIMPFRYRDDIAPGDAAFDVWATTLNEFCADAVDATVNVMVENLESIRERETIIIEGEAESYDLLLFTLLEEIIYYKDADRCLLRIFAINISKEDNLYSFTATARGEQIDPNRHILIVDVKAVTLHRLEVIEYPDGWRGTVVLDI